MLEVELRDELGLWFPERSERGLERERASLLPGETGRAGRGTRGKRGSAAVEKERRQGTSTSDVEIGTVLGYTDWGTRFRIVNQRLDQSGSIGEGKPVGEEFLSDKRV